MHLLEIGDRLLAQQNAERPLGTFLDSRGILRKIGSWAALLFHEFFSEFLFLLGRFGVFVCAFIELCRGK